MNVLGEGNIRHHCPLYMTVVLNLMDSGDGFSSTMPARIEFYRA